MPIACWSLATMGDLASLWWGEPAWCFSGWLLLAGIGFSLPAMPTGFLELARLAESHPAIREVNRHMLMVMLALAFYTASLFMRLLGAHLDEPGAVAMGLSVPGFAFLGVAGWIGGTLVYPYRLGVSQPPFG